MREKLADLAEAHGWTLQIVESKEGPEHE
jgi:hypothetical protein